MVPLMARMEPKTHTATYATLPMTFIMGCMIPDRNWDFQFASYTSLLRPSNFSPTFRLARLIRTTS